MPIAYNGANAARVCYDFGGTLVHIARFGRESEHVTLYTSKSGDSIATNREPGSCCTATRNLDRCSHNLTGVTDNGKA